MTFQEGRSYEPAGSYETGWSVVPWMIVPPSPPPSSSPPQPPAASTSNAAPTKRKILRLRPTFSLLLLPSRVCTSLDRPRFGHAGSWDSGANVACPRVEKAVEDVHHQVRQDDDHGKEDGDPHHNGVIACTHGDDEVAADARNPEDRLDDERARDQAAETI